MCRCRETAQIAFGSNYVTDAALREIASADAERPTDQKVAFRDEFHR
jgi:hypothetical protein